MSNASTTPPVSHRGHWKSQFGFLMAAIGSAIGLGNLWRFPYLVGTNGGAIFVLVYLVLLAIVGIPLMLTEITIGQYGQSDALGSYKKIHPKVSFFGAMGILAAVLMLSFYGTIGGWVTYYVGVYFMAIFGGTNPAGKSMEVFSELISVPSLSISWHLVFMLACIVIVLGGLQKGTERANKIMIPLLFFSLLILGFAAMTLPGSSEGLSFYLKPDFSKLSFSVLGSALGQVFFSLSLGMGTMITYGSYLSKKQSGKKNSVVIPICDTLAALLAGLVIFPAVFATGMKPGSGPGLIFVTLPEVFNKLPGGNYIGLIFFVTVLFAAISSAISALEIPVAYLVDQKKVKRQSAVLWLGLAITLLGILPSLSNGNGPLTQFSISALFGNPEWMKSIKFLTLNPFDLPDYIVSYILLPLGGLALCIGGAWIMGKEKLLGVITHNGTKPFKLGNLYFTIIKYIAPIAILIIFVQSLFS
ncbi:MAG: sodium-dependent transporter [Spirochaetia bacterium]